MIPDYQRDRFAIHVDADGGPDYEWLAATIEATGFSPRLVPDDEVASEGSDTGDEGPADPAGPDTIPALVRSALDRARQENKRLLVEFTGDG